MPNKEGKSIVEHLSDLNKGMKKNLKDYGLEDIYGLFLAVAFMLALSGGVAFSIGSEGMNFVVSTAIFTLLGGLGSFFLVSYVLIPIYHEAYQDKAVLKTLLSYQILDLFVGVVISIVFKSTFPMAGSILVFFTLAFVHPISKHLYGTGKTIEDLKSTLNKVYVILIILQGLITLIMKFSGLF